MHIETDILIIGGGIAGCIAAIALSDTYKVVLVDKTSEPNERIGECLAPAARRILKQLNLLDGLNLNHPYSHNKSSAHLKHIGTKSFWGSNQVHFVDHLRNPDGFGWHLDRKAFEMYLRQSAKERGVTCIWPSKLYKSEFNGSHWQVSLTNQDKNVTEQAQNISAKFVIDASGRQSTFARSQDIQRLQIDKLISCWAILPNSEELILGTITASEQGWWYSAPLPGNKRVLAYQTDSDLLHPKDRKTIDGFIKLAKNNEAIQEIISNCPNDNITFKGTVSANSTRLKEVTGKQWAALGDAAISFDPLSSQGMFNAMANALQLSELIKNTKLVDQNNSENTKEFITLYTQQIDNVWNQYLHHKTLFYNAEKRWNNSSFWKRRHG